MNALYVGSMAGLNVDGGDDSDSDNGANGSEWEGAKKSQGSNYEMKHYR